MSKGRWEEIQLNRKEAGGLFRKFHTISPVIFCYIKGLVGPVKQGGFGIPFFKNSNNQASGHFQLLIPIDKVIPFHLGTHFIGQLSGIIQIHFIEEDDKLHAPVTK